MRSGSRSTVRVPGDRLAFSARWVLWGFLAVALFVTAQLAWWMIFNVRMSSEQLAWRQAALLRDRRLAAMLLQQREPTASWQEVAAQIEGLFADLQVQPGAAPGDSAVVQVRPGVIEQLQARHRSRLRMFFWEGGAFFGILMLGVALIHRTLRRDVRLLRRQANFLSSVTHELKSPLASIRLFAETMELRDPSPDKRSRYLRNIRQDVERLEALVTDLLAVARLDAGSFPVQPEPGDLGQDLAELVEPLRAEIGESGATLDLDVPQQPVTACYDIAALQTVLRNLIDNAVKYGGEQKRVQVTLRAEQTQAIIEVTDWGLGLACEDTERIFERFYRVGDEMVRQTSGSGLGLYLVRELLRQSGGEVTAHSDGPGRGSTFRVALPIRSSEEEVS